MAYEKLQQFHDARVLGIAVSQNGKEAELLFRMDQSVQTRAVLKAIFEDVILLRLVDFSHDQNIVSRALVYGGDPVDSETIRHHLLWVTSTTITDSYLKEDKISEICNGIINGKNKLFYFEPSLGAELVVVSKSIRFT
jgi:hypothetical protein